MQPISAKGWSFDDLLAKGERFKPAPRVSCTSQNLEKEIQQYEDGLPLVIEGWHQSSRWPKNIFTLDYCHQYFLDNDKKISVRNVHTRLNKMMRFDDFIEKSRDVSPFASAEETERWYGKDVECPDGWEDWLRNSGVLPRRLIPDGSNDLLALRPKNKDGRPDVETLMCYFGVADTYTSCHKDLCASSGHNLMCYAEKDGSAFWFMTKGSDCYKVTQYFRTLKHELDHESHHISVSELAKAPFDVYIVEQKLGDLVLVPPRSCHQVINYGGLTVKMSWSRMTLPGLTAGLYHELPLYRRVCRPEIYRVKSTVYYAVRHYTQKLGAMVDQPFDSIQKAAMTRHLTTILHLYDQILSEEFSPFVKPPKIYKTQSRHALLETEPQSSQLADEFCVCDFCGADIFQSYFQCTGAAPRRAGEKGFIVCPGCYVEGRTCACEGMEQMQCRKFDVLFQTRWAALQVLKDIGGSVKSFGGSESLREQEKYFAEPSESSVFHAAVLLFQWRFNQRQRPSRACRNKQDSHSVSAAWALNCKKCHASKCFVHLLESRMHSMQALLLQEQDQSHATYHKEHTSKSPQYSDKKQALLLAQEEGKPHTEFHTLMVFNSLTFKVCQPVNDVHAKLGWYDKQLPKEKRIVQERPISEVIEPQKELVASDTTRSSASPQPSSKNHAYVEVKRVKHRPLSPTATMDHSSSSLSSISQEDADVLNLFPEHCDSRTESSALSRGPLTTIAKAETSWPSRPAKTYGSYRDQSGDGTIFATVYPIGPPRKRKRQEMASKSKDATGEPPKTKEPNNFAAALGAAINQVAESATMNKSIGPLQKPNNPKKRPRDNAAAPAPGSSTRARRTGGEDSIVVNVSELQDLVIQTAERVVRRIVGETASSSSLTTKTAVSMMTEYAAAGTFLNGNNQMRFPSLKHFADVSPPVNRSQGASTSHPPEKKRALPPHSEGGNSAGKKRRIRVDDESD